MIPPISIPVLSSINKKGKYNIVVLFQPFQKRLG